MHPIIEAHIKELRAQLIAVPVGDPFPCSTLTYTFDLNPKVGDRFCNYINTSINAASTVPSEFMAQWFEYQYNPISQTLANVIEDELRKSISGFKDVVIDALVVNHIYKAEHETNPQKALAELIDWEIKLAKDPVLNEPNALELGAAVRRMGLTGDAPPVDRSKRQLTDGSPVPEDHSHVKLRPNGQQEGYVVLSPEERAKGFVRPVRDSYVHVGRPICAKMRPPEKDGQSIKLGGPRDMCGLPHKHKGECGEWMYVTQYQHAQALSIHHYGGCGTVTKMGRAIAETYARDPKFYDGTFCVGCGKHFPLDQFFWDGTNQIVGS